MGTTTYYQLNGKTTTEQVKGSFAYSANGSRFYLRAINHNPVNPHMTINVRDSRWVEVNKRCFDQYVKFLSNGSHVSYANAQRYFIEGLR